TQVEPDKPVVSSLNPSKKSEPDDIPGENTTSGTQTGRPKSFAPPVYQPPPEQLAQLEKQFPTRGPIQAETSTRQQSARPPVSHGPPQPMTGPDAKSGKIRPRETGPKTEPPARPVRPANRPAPVTYLISRWPAPADARHFDSLKAAFAAAPADRDTIVEIHDNGPLFVQPVALAGRRLTLRAGDGYRPLLAWDTTAAGSANLNRLFQISKGSLALENLDVVFKHSNSTQDEANAVVRLDGGEFAAVNCTFSVAGKHRAGTAIIQVDGMTGGAGKCDLSHC